MDKYDAISTDENILILNVPDDVLERAAAAPDFELLYLQLLPVRTYRLGRG